MAVVHIAVAVIIDAQNRALISLRRKDTHQGGLWEFPGGKVEAGETIRQALYRELHEELNILIQSVRPLITLSHDYNDKQVCLHVWKVQQYCCEAGVNLMSNQGAEGQAIKWLDVNKLDPDDFPAADKAIISVLKLPDRYLISGEFSSLEDFKKRLSHAIEQGVRLLQLRLKTSWVKANRQRAQQVVEHGITLACNTAVSLMLNIPDELRLAILDSAILATTILEPAILSEAVSGHISGGIGLHFNSVQLNQLSVKRIQAYRQSRLKPVWLAASCHSQSDLQQAQTLGLDFAVLSPVKKTTSHPLAKPMGWSTFRSLVEQSSIPVYALGGMSEKDIMLAQQAGAQGIAGISFGW